MSDNGSNWRSMFERNGTGNAQQMPRRPQPVANPFGGYDDGFDPSQPDPRGELPHPPLKPDEIIDETAMALALDTHEYKPWALQRGRGRPAMMLHLRRYEPKSGLWCGWQMAYPHLIAVEYTGDRMLSLDFGARQFVIEGSGLHELARHLQNGSVLMVQEYSDKTWPSLNDGSLISSILQI